MTSHAALYADRLHALRDELGRLSLTGFVVPLTDEHMSEYVGAYAQRLAWLTGFQGSAGTAVVLRGAAAMFTDGRYTLQVREQVDGAHWAFVGVPETSVGQWLAAHAPSGSRIGYDPWLHSRRWVDQTTRALAGRGVDLVAVAANPVDAIWRDRAAPSVAAIDVQPLAFSGKPLTDKLADIAAWLTEKQADSVVLSALDSIAWTFNIRGRDIDRTPVALAFALVHADGSAALFTDPAKVTPEVLAHLGNRVSVRPRAEFAGALSAFAGKSVAVDPQLSVVAIFDALEAAGATIFAERDPTVLPKAVKNPVEVAGMRAAHVRDGAALSRFLQWLSVAGPAGAETELSVVARLQRFREETGALVDLSFDTIAGYGPNGAVVHYRAEDRTNRAIAPGGLLLVDSGGQYRDGTTDVTRTIAIGTPSDAMRRHFTLVLKGHIALAQAVFPVGTRGGQLDILARQFLWAEGLDYAHGTGHGVGSFLSVHEGPQRIATSGEGDEVLQPGMVLSNEPGYYRTGDYGIRIENLVLVVPCDIAGAERSMLGFETLTLAPIDRTLVDRALLTPGERAWLDAYHARVRDGLAPLVDDVTRAWLAENCAPL